MSLFSLLSPVFVVPSFHPNRCFPGNRAGSCFTWSQSQALMVLHWLIPMGAAPLNNPKQRAGEMPFLALRSLLPRLPKAINNKRENKAQTNYCSRKRASEPPFYSHWLADYLDEPSREWNLGFAFFSGWTFQGGHLLWVSPCSLFLLTNTLVRAHFSVASFFQLLKLCFWVGFLCLIPRIWVPAEQDLLHLFWDC